MKFILVWSYDNYINAHLALGRLKEDGFNCWLKDENTVTIDPMLSNAIGGIKLMVEESEAKQAWGLLNQLQIDHKNTIACPHCGSHNIELVTTPRKASNWINAIGTFLLGSYALANDTAYHCFNCNNEFEEKDVVHSSEN
jgi:DNA-directed RNA polymerase subunit RPC12/RpoP